MTMKLEYSIVAAVVGAIYLIVKQFAPDFPIPADIFLNVFVFILALLGVEVTKPAANKFRDLLEKG